jgi:hypothetical protein
VTEPIPTDTHQSLVKELAQADPVYRDVGDKRYCVLCNAENIELGHRHDCLWLRARKLISWEEEQAQKVAGADLPPTQKF